jgi:hypothetical protein
VDFSTQRLFPRPFYPQILLQSLKKIHPQPRPKGHGIALAVRITFETENPPGSTRVTRAATLRQPISAKEADVPGNSQPSATLNFRPFEQLRPIPIAALTDSES